MRSRRCSLTGPAATVQIHAYGDTPEAAVLALRDTMRQLTPLRERSGATRLRCWTRARWRRE